MNCPLYRPDQERGACGIGFVADTSGEPSFGVLEMLLTCAANLTKRAALDADAGTAVGFLTAGSEAT